MFEFSSGIAQHPSGHGAWQVQLAHTGEFSVRHAIPSHTILYGPFKLTDKENAYIWGLVEDAEIEGLRSSTRAGVPDEAQYTFTLHLEEGQHTSTLWVSDALKNLSLAILVMQLGTLIETYTDQTPIIR